MSRNPIQMQKGLSLSQFIERYGSEEQCRAAPVGWRWPDGFVCPQCSGTAHTVVGRRRLYHCHGCRAQTSVIAGTVFSKTLLPLTKWFQGMFLLTQAKNSISGLELARQLGVRPDRASLMRHKLMSVMAEREGSRKLDGRVEMDDVVLGGERGVLDGGKQGRAGPNKTPFAVPEARFQHDVAVATDDDGHPQRLLLRAVKTHDGAEIEAMARAHLEPTARVVSDGLGCFRAVPRIGCTHTPVNVTKSSNHGEKLACFRWANTIVGNIKTAIVGTLKSVARRYVYRYLAEFQYRFNRHADLPAMLTRLAYVAVRAAPRPRKSLQLAYAAG